MSKVNNKDTRRYSGAFIVNFERILKLFLGKNLLGSFIFSG